MRRHTSQSSSSRSKAQGTASARTTGSRTQRSWPSSRQPSGTATCGSNRGRNCRESSKRGALAAGSVTREDGGSRTRKGVLKAAVWIPVWLVLVMTGCGSEDPTSAGDASPTTAAATAESSRGGVGKAAIVGRWERVHRCTELVAALDAAGLREVAALAEKDELCEGAKPPFVHSHFFDAEGRFVSLDENESQVDEGGYEVIANDTIRLGGDQGVDF